MIRRLTPKLSLIILLAGLVARNAAAASYVAIEKIPGVTPVTVDVSDKPRVYFRVTSDSPLVFTIEGPAHVRIVSRVECSRTGVATYRLLATEDGKLIDKLDSESSAAADARLEKGSTPIGKSRRLTFDLPGGHHKLSLSLSAATAALVRIQTSSERGGQAMVSLTPIAAEGSVNVAEGEKLIPYYTITAGQPVKLRVIGPTVLELSSRLDFDATMRGTQAYRLRLTEQGKPLREIELKTTKAVAASYENVRDRVPSKIDVTRFPVADGTHEITVELLAPERGTVRVHARIPEPSVGNRE